MLCDDEIPGGALPMLYFSQHVGESGIAWSVFGRGLLPHYDMETVCAHAASNARAGGEEG